MKAIVILILLGCVSCGLDVIRVESTPVEEVVSKPRSYIRATNYKPTEEQLKVWKGCDDLPPSMTHLQRLRYKSDIFDEEVKVFGVVENVTNYDEIMIDLASPYARGHMQIMFITGVGEEIALTINKGDELIAKGKIENHCLSPYFSMKATGVWQAVDVIRIGR